MKVYSGDRTIDGVKVTVDGAPLDPCINVMEFSKNGFEWSYEGPEPRQLALALLVDHLGECQRRQGHGRALHAGGGRQFRQRVGNEFGRSRSGAGGACRQGGCLMPLQYRAAVLHAPQTPMSIETVTAAALKPTDVLVRIRATGLCHTDLEVIEGSLRYPLPIVLGHEAAGIVEQVGPAARGVKAGDHVVLSWNPHCGHCFYCDRDAPILCEEYLGKGPQGGVVRRRQSAPRSPMAAISGS